MALTEKGKIALAQVIKHYPKGKFSAKDLSDACGERIVAATLNGVVNNGYLTKYEGSPVMYEAFADIEDLLSAALEEQNKGCTNKNLSAAKKAKNDEFYTRYEDVEAEIWKYKKHFENKIVYLPCDEPAEKKSEFWTFFVKNFTKLGLKKIIATHYDENGGAYKIWIDGDTTGDGYVCEDDALQEDLEGNGDFRSDECTEILKNCDIVCTNPPFSMFRDFVEWIVSNNKEFLIIGSQNAFTYKEIFKLIKENKIWTGYNMVKEFYQPDGSIKKFGNICWFTNIKTNKRMEEIILTKNYNSINYPSYDNYEGIEVSKVIDIPKNFDGIMGVPITFIDKYNPEQFEILACSAYSDELCYGSGALYVNDNKKYARVLIKRK